MAFNGFSEELIKILSIAKEIIQAIPVSSQAYTTPTFSKICPSPTLSLPPPSSICEDLLKRDVPLEVIHKVEILHRRTLGNFQRLLQSSFAETWNKIASLPRHEHMLPLEKLGKELVNAYESYYFGKVDNWKEEFCGTIASRLTGQIHEPERQSENRRIPFNYNYTPVLEAYFAENATPSRAHKLFLAAQSGMSYRQIHIWFQNRRKRTGRRRQLPYTAKCAAEVHTMPCRNFPKECTACLNEGGETIYWPSEENFYTAKQESLGTKVTSTSSRPGSSKVDQVDPFDTLQAENPIYAFPAFYPPSCREDPFPCRFGDTSSCKARLGPRQWFERQQSQRDTNHDVLSLVIAFEKLNICGEEYDSSGNSERCNRTGVSGSQGSGLASIYITRPLRAPLDSLVRDDANRRPTTLNLARITSNLHLPPAAVQSGKASCAEGRGCSSIDFRQLHSRRARDLTEADKADTTSIYTLPSDSEEYLPSLSYSSSSSVASDDGCSQGSPVLSFPEQDFLSPLLLCADDSLPYTTLFSLDNTKV